MYLHLETRDTGSHRFAVSVSGGNGDDYDDAVDVAPNDEVSLDDAGRHSKDVDAPSVAVTVTVDGSLERSESYAITGAGICLQVSEAEPPDTVSFHCLPVIAGTARAITGNE